MKKSRQATATTNNGEFPMILKSQADRPIPATGADALFRPEPRTVWLWSGLLLAGTLVVFFPALQCGFVGIDDPNFVVANRHVLAGITWGGAKWAFQPGQGDYWHPLTWLSLMLDDALFGPGPQGFHLTNILLHAVNVVLLFQCLARWTGAVGCSLMVAALFAVHPLRVESVAWISERKDVLSTLFWFSSLLAYGWYTGKKSRIGSQGADEASGNAGRRKAGYALALLFFVLGLMSKAMIVTLPLVLLLLDWWPLRRFDAATVKKRPSVLGPLIVEKLPFFVLAAISATVTYWGQHWGAKLELFPGFTPVMRVENAFIAYSSYLGKTFWPAKLAVWYPHPGHWPALRLAGGILLLAGISAVAWRARRRRPYFPAGWLWFVITLVPVIGLTKGWFQYEADRFTYIPLTGIFVALAWGTADLSAKWREQKRILPIMGLAVLVPCVALTRTQLGYWIDSETLFRHTAAVTVNNRFAQSSLALALQNKGLYDEAFEHYDIALGLPPDDFDTRNNYGVLLMKVGQLDDAIRQFERAARLNPHWADPHNNLGVAFYREGRLDDAIAQFQQALALNPDDFGTRSNLLAVIERKKAETNRPANPGAP